MILRIVQTASLAAQFIVATLDIVNAFPRDQPRFPGYPEQSQSSEMPLSGQEGASKGAPVLIRTRNCQLPKLNGTALLTHGFDSYENVLRSPCVGC